MILKQQTTSDPRWSRRRFLHVAGTSAVGTWLVGCSGESNGDERGTPSSDEMEAPSLSELVESGDLPPLADRLPTEPLVIEPVDRVGVYGGTWNTAIEGPSDLQWLRRTIDCEPLAKWTPDTWQVIPNVAAAIDIEEGGLVYVIRLREGMRWSDGQLFTADDILFAFNDVLSSTEIMPILPAAFTSPDGSPAQMEKADDLTIRVTFAVPNGMFQQSMADNDGRFLLLYPRHYFEQFHPQYNPDADSNATDFGLAAWTDAFAGEHQFHYPGTPVLSPWVVTTGVGEGTRVVAGRNPYYWKVDPDGRQLPYLDSVIFNVVSDPEVMVLSATNGEFDFHTRHFNTPANRVVLAESRDGGEYDFVDIVPSLMNEMMIMFNLTHRDLRLRQIFQNKDFRIGLSHALNREEMAAAIYLDQAEPWQGAPRRESEFFNEELAKQYTEFDVGLANEHLDRAGFAQRDSEGFRLDQESQRVSFAVLAIDPYVDAMELVRSYWAEVGIEVRIDTAERSLWNERVSGNEHDAAVWVGPGGLGDAILEGHHYLPFHAGSRYAILWKDWYQSGGTKGEEPPEAPQRQLELYDQILGTADADGQADLFREILQIAKDEFYCIGTVMPTAAYGIVANRFRNVPDTIQDANLTLAPGNTRPEQYFIDEA